MACCMRCDCNATTSHGGWSWMLPYRPSSKSTPAQCVAPNGLRCQRMRDDAWTGQRIRRSSRHRQRIVASACVRHRLFADICLIMVVAFWVCPLTDSHDPMSFRMGISAVDFRTHSWLMAKWRLGLSSVSSMMSSPWTREVAQASTTDAA